MKIVLICLLAFIFFYLIFVYLIALAIHSKFFNHRQEINPRIKSYTLEDFAMKTEKIEVSSKKGIIRGNLYFCANSISEILNNKLVILCHGMNSTKESYLQEIGYFATHGYLILAFDYLGTNESDGFLRGFGNSLSSTSAVLDFINTREDLKNRELYVFGHSWGGYAATNIATFHPEVKGIIALAPVLSIKTLVTLSDKKYLPLAKFFFLLIDYIKCGSFSKQDALLTLSKFSKQGGKIMVIQSLEDSVVHYKTSLGLLKQHFEFQENERIKFVTVQNRNHNPHYTERAANLVNQFFSELPRIKDQDLDDYYKRFDFRAMGKLDDAIMKEICNFIESI